MHIWPAIGRGTECEVGKIPKIRTGPSAQTGTKKFRHARGINRERSIFEQKKLNGEKA